MTNELSVFKLLEGLKIGGRLEDTRHINHIRREQAVFKKVHPDRHVAVMRSKFKEGVTIIMRAE